MLLKLIEHVVADSITFRHLIAIPSGSKVYRQRSQLQNKILIRISYTDHGILTWFKALVAFSLTIYL